MTLRAVLSIIAAEDLEIAEMDINTAFLHGDLIEEIYLQQPEGFIVAGKEHEVYRLHTSLYGLKQAPRTRNQKFNNFLIKFGLVASQSDPCVYYQPNGNDVIMVAIWVDDGLLASN